MTAMKTIAATSPVDWVYSSEGGANLVFRYLGPPHPSFTHKILRVGKTSRPSPVPPHLPADPDQIHPPQDPSTLFRDEVMLPLLTEEFMPGQEPVRLEREFLEELERQSQEKRADWRIEAEGGGIDKGSRVGLLVDDLTGERKGKGRVLAVEIKPKWGFFPSTSHLSEFTKPFKTNYCRTCMHRLYKMSKVKPSFSSPPFETSDSPPSLASDYCPIDIYSGNPARVSRALEQLWAGWIEDNGQGNSLRLFVDGKIVDPREPSSLSTLLFPSSPTSLPLPALYALFSTLFLPSLTSTPIFPRLASLQSSLDPLDIEGLLATIPNLLTATPSQPTLEEFAAFVRTYTATPAANPEEQKWTDRERITAFLLSAAFKDCSLIFRVPIVADAQDLGREVTVKVIDLDPKPVERMGKWAKLDGEIVRFFASWVEAEKKAGRKVRRCVDG